MNHCKAVAEALQGLSWVAYTGPGCGLPVPAAHVEEAWNSGEFWANKVLRERKAAEGGAAHVEWCRRLKALFLALKVGAAPGHPPPPSPLMWALGLLGRLTRCPHPPSSSLAGVLQRAPPRGPRLGPPGRGRGRLPAGGRGWLGRRCPEGPARRAPTPAPGLLRRGEAGECAATVGIGMDPSRLGRPGRGPPEGDA